MRARVIFIRGAVKLVFSEKVGHLAQQGGKEVSPKTKFLLKFSKIKFALVNGKKCDETHNKIIGGAISYQFMRFLDPPIPNYSLSQPKKMKFFMKNNMLRIA